VQDGYFADFCVYCNFMFWDGKKPLFLGQQIVEGDALKMPFNKPRNYEPGDCVVVCKSCYGKIYDKVCNQPSQTLHPLSIKVEDLLTPSAISDLDSLNWKKRSEAMDSLSECIDKINEEKRNNEKVETHALFRKI
jgi:hypothetical protein